MPADQLISVEHVSKKFCRDLSTSLRYGFLDLGRELIGKPRTSELRPKEFWAVRDASFELRRGECLGLIGHNGAGKTTLLRILNGLIKPDRGRIEIRGQVGALIALGAGFNPILTGRENIYINAAVLGLSRKAVDARLEEIIDFAGVEQFIDMPVQHYSSGMNVRLGFAIAAILIEPDILFLDEVLAVGDISFTIKCLNRVRELMRDSAVVFVSHNMPLISSFCTRVMVMDHGQRVLDTDQPGVAINQYYGLVRSEQQVSGTGAAAVIEARLHAQPGGAIPDDGSIQQGADTWLTVRLKVDDGVRVHVNAFIDDASMAHVIGVTLREESGAPMVLEPGTHQLRVPFGIMELNAGRYSVLLSLRDTHTGELRCRHQGLTPFTVLADQVSWAKIMRSTVTERLPMEQDHGDLRHS
jgi:lipopolysaccharide transport system ATP-binding protein